MTSTVEFDKRYATEQLRRTGHPLRRLIKAAYLKNVLHDVSGPTIDFGCGAGQLLARLPAGSVGVEINPYLVAELRKIDLNVLSYDPDIDQFCLRDFPSNRYETLVIAHVIEHFSDSDQVVRKLWRSCRRIGIRKIIVIVPGPKGYRSDKTHKTFIDQHYLHDHGLFNCEGYAVAKMRYFPLNVEVLGRFFTYHELKIVYERVV